jgi:osmotically-inducible protein OsmY
MKGVLHELRPAQPAEPLDDVGLAHKVESVLFRDPHVPKAKISINAEHGAVFLRGQIESADLIDDLVESVRKIPGVREVVSLLHPPGTEAPHPEPRL